MSNSRNRGKHGANLTRPLQTSEAEVYFSVFILRCNEQWQLSPPRGLSANEIWQQNTEQGWCWLKQIHSHSDVLLILRAVVSVLLKTAMHI